MSCRKHGLDVETLVGAVEASIRTGVGSDDSDGQPRDDQKSQHWYCDLLSDQGILPAGMVHAFQEHQHYPDYSRGQELTLQNKTAEARQGFHRFFCHSSASLAFKHQKLGVHSFGEQEQLLF